MIFTYESIGGQTLPDSVSMAFSPHEQVIYTYREGYLDRVTRLVMSSTFSQPISALLLMSPMETRYVTVTDCSSAESTRLGSTPSISAHPVPNPRARYSGSVFARGCAILRLIR